MRISDWSSDVCSSDLRLPVAPATLSIASTSGTPALNVTARVRAKRAIDELCSTLPITGTFSSTRSAVYCSLGERLYAYMKAKNAASATPSISHHHPTNMSDKIGRASCRERVCQYV